MITMMRPFNERMRVLMVMDDLGEQCERVQMWTDSLS